MRSRGAEYGKPEDTERSVGERPKRLESESRIGHPRVNRKAPRDIFSVVLTDPSMTTLTLCFSCCRPIELGAVIGAGKLHCCFDCAAETVRRESIATRVFAIGTGPDPGVVLRGVFESGARDRSQ